MPVILDTSVLVAYANRDDPSHQRAKKLMHRILKGAHGLPLGLDYVLDEGLTLLQRRTGREQHGRVFASYFFQAPGSTQPPILEFHTVTAEGIDRAKDLFFERFDRGLSFTDCVIASVARELSGTVATLEDGFNGLAPVVPG